MAARNAGSGDDVHTVRPRWTWLGLLVMLTGLVVLAVGVIAESWAWAVPGLVVLALGVAVAVYGGFFYDVSSPSLSGQLHDVETGDVHQVPGAGTMRSERQLKRDVRRRWLRGRR